MSILSENFSPVLDREQMEDVGEIFKETKYICAKCGGTSQGPRCSRVVSNQVCGGTCTVQEGLAESDINPAEHQWLVLGQGSPSTSGMHAFDADDVEEPADAVEEADWSYSIMWDVEAAALVPLVDTILKGHRCALAFGLNPASSYHLEIGHVAFLVDASPDARQALNELGVHLSPFNGLSKYNDVKGGTFREFDYPGMAALEKLTVSRQGMVGAEPRYHRPKEGETSGDYWARKIEIAKAQQQIKQPRVGESILDEADIAPSVDLDGINAEIEVLTAKYRATLNTNIYLSPKAVRDYPATLVLHTLNARRDAPRGTGTAFMTDLCALADRHGLMITLEAGEQRGSTGFKNTTSINRLRAFYARFGFQRNSGKRNYRPDLSGTMHRHARKLGEDYQIPNGCQWGLGIVHGDSRVSFWPCSEGQFFGIEHQQARERGYITFTQGDAKWRYKMGYIAWTSYPNPEEKIAVEDFCLKHGMEVKGHTTYVDNYDMATQKAAADSARYRRTFDQRRGVPSYAGKSEARERHIILGTSMKENDGKPQEPTNYPPGAHSNVRMVAYDALPRETQEDIAGWIAERAEIQALKDYAPGVPFHPFDLHDQLHGLVDPLMLAVRDLPVAAITDFRRNPDARIYAGKFQRGEVPPPILVDGTKFVDGGHRLAAALAAGTATIPTVDMWPLLRQDWAAWLRDETNTTHPVKGGMYERPEAREARLKSFEAELGLKYGLTKSYLTSPDPVPFDKEKLTVAEHHKWQKLQTKDWLNPNGEFHKLVEMAWPADFPSVILHTNVITMKSHVDYTAAKAGDIRAAKRVVETLAKPDKLRNIVHQHPDAVFLPVLAMEASGKNMLPLALARKLSKATGLGVETDIIQINKTFHTNSSGAHRLASIARFDGQAAQPTSYVLVDDVVTSGGTLAAMRQHVEESGGRVVAITALAAAAYANVVAITAGTLQRLYAKFPGAELDILLKELKIAPDRTDLTNSQANYVLKFLTVDALRRALEKA